MRNYIILLTIVVSITASSASPINRREEDLAKVYRFINKYLGDEATTEEKLMFYRIFADLEHVVQGSSHKHGSRLTSRSRRTRRTPDTILTEMITMINEEKQRKSFEQKLGLSQKVPKQRKLWNDCLVEMFMKGYTGERAKAKCNKLYPQNN